MKNSREEELMNQRLAAYQENPSDALWSKIAVALPAKAPAWTAITELAAVLFVVGLMAWSSTMSVTPNEIVVNGVDEKKGVAEDSRRSGGFAEDNIAVQVVTAKQKVASVLKRSNQSSPFASELAAENPSAYPLLPPRILRETIADAKPLTDSTSDAASLTIQPTEEPKDIITPKRNKKSHLRFYASVTPSLSFQKIIPLANDNIIVHGMAPTPSLSIKRFGLGADLGLQHQLTKALSVYGGLSFYRQQQQVTYYYDDGTSDVTRIDNDAWSFEVTPVKQEKTFDYTMTNVGIQSGLIATVNSHLLIHQFGAGLNFQKGIGKGRGDSSYNNSASNYLMLRVFYRSEFAKNEKYSFFLQPEFNYGVESREKLDAPFQLKPYRAGITVGILIQN